jgi:hypothetical protein
LYANAYRLGKRASGNLTSVTPEEQSAIKKIRIDEYRFLKGFLADMRSGAGKIDYQDRAAMYGRASFELYWLGYALGNKDPKRRLKWQYGDTYSHCPDCSRFAAHGPYTMEQFQKDIVSAGKLPQSGGLACVGISCKCLLEESFIK